MISKLDFECKQLLFVFAKDGDKISFSNDNIVIKDKDGNIKHQSTCYRLFIVFVIGDITITSGIIKRANTFGFTICMMTYNMKVYQLLGSHMVGNTLLHKKQYKYDGIDLGREILKNKLSNQRDTLLSLDYKTKGFSNRINTISNCIAKLEDCNSIQQMMGQEGLSAKAYFREIFSTTEWKGRQPQIKRDFINSTLDIGYTILFNLVDALLQSYDFDTYCGVLHREFYMRQSLVCDIMEPMRCMIDLKVREGINYGQFKEADFTCLNNKYQLKWENSAKYTSLLLEPIMENRENMFLYVQGYYRAFMKTKNSSEFPKFEVTRC